MQKDKKTNDYFDRYTDAEPIHIGILDFAKVIVSSLVVVIALVYLRRNSVYPLYHKLSDACFLVSVVLMAVGIFSFANQDGFFDSAGFTFRKFREIKRLFKPKDDKEKKLTYYEYKESKAKKRGRGFKYHYLLIGAVFLIAAIVFMKLNNM